jgi:hypothetical protein
VPDEIVRDIAARLADLVLQHRLRKAPAEGP